MNLQSFQSGSMSVECSTLPSGFSSSDDHFYQWQGTFSEKNYRYLIDSVCDVSQDAGSVFFDVTGVYLKPTSTLRFPDDAFPVGFPFCTIIAKPEQMKFWEDFAQEALHHGVRITVVESEAYRGGAAL